MKCIENGNCDPYVYIYIDRYYMRHQNKAQAHSDVKWVELAIWE